MEDSKKVHLPSIKEVLTDGCKFVINRIDLAAWFLLTSLVGMFAFGITFLPLIFVWLMPGWFITTVMLLGVMLGLSIFILSGTALTYAVYKSEKSGKCTFKEGLVWALQNFWPIVWLGTLATLVVMTGFMFLLVPGLVVGVLTSFYVLVYMDEGHKGISALVRSTEVVLRRPWAYIGKMIGIWLPLVLILSIWTWLVEELYKTFEYIGGLVEGVLTVLVGAVDVVIQMGVSVFAVYVLVVFYRAMSRGAEDYSEKSRPKVRVAYKALAVIGCLTLFAGSFFTGFILGNPMN
ncbi:hypothetical protein CL653_01265 [bacterium]|nr:hypothetical protein [bacterium]|tara:strand:+ start:1377 stop:2249 length:873 start_codon:yes stop_codon:yes gene_type:complete